MTIEELKAMKAMLDKARALGDEFWGDDTPQETMDAYYEMAEAAQAFINRHDYDCANECPMLFMDSSYSHPFVIAGERDAGLVAVVRWATGNRIVNVTFDDHGIYLSNNVEIDVNGVQIKSTGDRSLSTVITVSPEAD